MIIDFGKANKGKELSECDTKYLTWLVQHEKVLAKRNRWACRDAKFILKQREEAKAAPKVNNDWQDWHNALKGSAKTVSNDIAAMGTLHGAKAFSLLR